MKLLRLSITLLLFGWAFTLAQAQEVSNVKAIQNKNIITLMWTVSNETSPYCCYIEMSTDGKHFEPIGKVKGTQSYMDKQYYYQIKGFTMPQVWFRIKKSPYQSKSAYSEVVFLKVKNETEFSQVYPETLD